MFEDDKWRMFEKEADREEGEGTYHEVKEKTPGTGPALQNLAQGYKNDCLVELVLRAHSLCYYQRHSPNLLEQGPRFVYEQGPCGDENH